MEKVRAGALTFTQEDFDGLSGLNEAVCRYQIARKRFDHLSLIGSGAGGAVSLMLAGRFMPDEIHLFPTLGLCTQEFLKEVSRIVPFPYFVCAPVKIYLSKAASSADVRLFKRLLMRLSSFEKEIVFVNSIHNADNLLSICVNCSKTLAQR